MKIPKNILNTITDEQKKKLEAARTPEELLAIAKEGWRELSLEQMEGISGGWCVNCDDYNSVVTCTSDGFHL